MLRSSLIDLRGAQEQKLSRASTPLRSAGSPPYSLAATKARDTSFLRRESKFTFRAIQELETDGDDERERERDRQKETKKGATSERIFGRRSALHFEKKIFLTLAEIPKITGVVVRRSEWKKVGG